MSGWGTPPLCWEGGSRGRGPFLNSTCLLGSVVGVQGWEGSSSFLPEGRSSPAPSSLQDPTPTLKAIPVHSSSRPGTQKKTTQNILVHSHLQELRALGHPLPPFQSSGGRVPLETTSRYPSPCVPECGGRGPCVSAQVSYPAVGGPDSSACVRVFARAWGFLCASGSLLGVSVGSCISPLSCIRSPGMHVLGCVPPCVRVTARGLLGAATLPLGSTSSPFGAAFSSQWTPVARPAALPLDMNPPLFPFLRGDAQGAGLQG